MQQMLVEREVSIAVRTGTSTSTYSCLLVEAVVAKRHAENNEKIYVKSLQMTWSDP